MTITLRKLTAVLIAGVMMGGPALATEITIDGHGGDGRYYEPNAGETRIGN